MYRLCKDDQTISRFKELVPKEFDFMSNSNDSANQTDAKREELRDSALMVIHWIGQLYPTCFYPSMRIVALEMLQKLSVYLPFEARLGQVLPYVAKIFDTAQTESHAP